MQNKCLGKSVEMTLNLIPTNMRMRVFLQNEENITLSTELY